MIKKILLSGAICFAVCSCSAQNDSSTQYLKKGIEEKKAGRYREAEKSLMKANQFSPNTLNIFLELGDVLQAQRRYAEARQYYLKAFALDNNNPIGLENLTFLSFNLRKWDDAILYAQKIQQLKIGKPVNSIIGQSFYEKGQYGEAIKYLQLAAKEEPAKPEIPYKIGRSYLEMSNYRQAAPYLEKAISLDSSKINWIYETGLVYDAVPDFKKALFYIKLAGEKGYVKNNDYLENLGNAYMNEGNIEKGIETLKEVLKAKPSDQELLYQIAQAYYKGGKYQLAIDHWDEVLKLDQKNAHALYMIGMAYQKKGDKKKGMELCDRAIELDPSLDTYRKKNMPVGL